MKPIEIIAQDLFDKVRSRFTNLQMGDETGAITASPVDARFFDFDFVIEGNNLGRVSISINDTGNLKIFYSQGITENADSITQSMWYDFLKEMRYFAKRRLLRFDTRDITKGNLDKTDFQYLAQKGSKDNNMNESSMFGSSRTSHRKLENTDLIIRHSKAINPDLPGARSRQIKRIFIQNSLGERSLFPFAHLGGARAMQRHVANGGTPHDEIGEHIVNTCEEILKLSDFGRKIRHSTLNDNAHRIAERAGQKLQSLRRHIEGMGKQRYYEAWKETYAPDDNLIELDDATLESYKDTFTQTKFDEALAEVFPLLHKIMQETGEIDLESYVGEEKEEDCTECGLPESKCGCDHDSGEESKLKEFSEFENWTTNLIKEGFTDDELNALEELVQEPLPIGANDEAVQALKGIGIKDTELFDALRAIAKAPDGADVDARETIKTFLGDDADKISWGDLNPEDAGDQPTAPGEMPPGEMPQGEMPQGEMPPGEMPPGEMPPSEMPQGGMSSGGMLQGRGEYPLDNAYAEPRKKRNMIQREGYYLGPEDFQDWLKDATYRVAQGEVSDWTELYAELVSELGFDENKAERIAKRIYSHDTISKHRVRPDDDLERDIPRDDTSDSDDEFLRNLRQKRHKGSIKPDDMGGVDEEDVIQYNNKDKLIEPDSPRSKIKKVAELVMGFYDREKGTWTKGEHGVVTHVKRQFSDDDGKGGEEEARLAAKLIAHLNAEHQNKMHLEDIKRLSGLV